VYDQKATVLLRTISFFSINLIWRHIHRILFPLSFLVGENDQGISNISSYKQHQVCFESRLVITSQPAARDNDWSRTRNRMRVGILPDQGHLQGCTLSRILHSCTARAFYQTVKARRKRPRPRRVAFVQENHLHFTDFGCFSRALVEVHKLYLCLINFIG